MTSVTAPAFAKINLTLDVLSPRPDGYHDLRSVMQTIALHDTLRVTYTPDIPGVRLTVDGDEAEGVPTGPENIVHRAAVRLQKTAAARGLLPASRSGLHLHLTKQIPSQAGLGGGSSDAAATLLTMARLFGLSFSASRLRTIAAALGADVPFFLTGGTALVEGLGEQVTPLPPLKPAWPLVVVKPPIGVSTAAAYALLDAAVCRVPGTATDRWLAAPHSTPLGNDFEAVVRPAQPAVQATFDLLSDLQGQTIANAEGFKPQLCGSGSAVFCRVSTVTDAARIAAQIRASGIGKAWATQTQENNHDS